MTGLPTIRADLLLAHAPAFFDFRHRRDVYFPYLSTSGDVPITPLYEYFPVGFKTLQSYLGERGHDVKLVNLATVLLKYPRLDLDSFLRSVDTKIFGVDLHWMVHVQGALAIAERFKTLHPDIPVILGGISSTWYADELIRYPFVDMVMRGYDTHVPMEALMSALSKGEAPRAVPNLLWKLAGEILDNGFSYQPESFSCAMDWSQMPPRGKQDSLPILEMLSTQNAGCAYNCGWCGGSRDAFRRVMRRHKTMARKPLVEVEREFSSMQKLSNVERFHFYSVGSYNEPKSRMLHFLNLVRQTPFKSISYEQFHLTPDDMLESMVGANRRTIITLSPESHDMKIAKLAGRGVYSPAEMEAWIRKALDKGVFEIDVWYFVGMPEQDERSVHETVEYCQRLLKLFKGERVVPLICPMVPFLDPASTFFEEPAAHGYRVFHRSVEEHRRGMERASLINRVNYETRWLPRAELVRVGYEAVRRLVEIKGEIGAMPESVATEVVERIDDALRMIDVVHRIDCIADPAERARELERIGDEILTRNDRVFFDGVSNQAFPINRDVGGRWFDELLHSPDALELAATG